MIASELSAAGVAPAVCDACISDVLDRLSALAERTDDREQLLGLLAQSIELARWNGPADVPLVLRAVAVMGVRNSQLEDAHIGVDVDAEQMIRRISLAAARCLREGFPTGFRGRPDADDPFAGIGPESYPRAWAAFCALARLRPGEGATLAPIETPRVEFSAVGAPRGARGKEPVVLSAMQEEIEGPLAARIEDLREHRADALMVPSLKFITRHPRKLARVVELVLQAKAPLVSANLLIEPTQVRLGSRTLNPYPFDNFRVVQEAAAKVRDLDADGVFSFVQSVYVERLPATSRNQPCWCGSGLKAKRCRHDTVESLAESADSWLASRSGG